MNLLIYDLLSPVQGQISGERKLVCSQPNKGGFYFHNENSCLISLEILHNFKTYLEEQILCRKTQLQMTLALPIK